MLVKRVLWMAASTPAGQSEAMLEMPYVYVNKYAFQDVSFLVLQHLKRFDYDWTKQ